MFNGRNLKINMYGDYARNIFGKNSRVISASGLAEKDYTIFDQQMNLFTHFDYNVIHMNGYPRHMIEI